MALTFTDLLLYGKTLGGGAPASAASPTGDISAMIKHLVEEAAKTSGGTDIAPTPDANGSIAERLAYLQRLTPLGAGIVRNMRDWAGGAGFEFWFGNFGTMLDTAAAAGNPSGLDGWSWSLGTNSMNVTSNGDLFSETDPGYNYANPSSGVTIRSPQIFGGVDGYRMAQIFLGQAPTKLVCEWYGIWVTVGTNTMAAYNGGMTNGLVASADAAGSAGVIVSDGTNFRLVSDNGNDAGAAVDTNPHLWRIEYGTTNTEWFIDDVSQGTITTETDIWPCNWAQRNDAAGNANRTMFGRVYYAL